MTEEQADAPVTTAKGLSKGDDAVAHLVQDKADPAMAARDQEDLMAGKGLIVSSSKQRFRCPQPMACRDPRLPTGGAR